MAVSQEKLSKVTDPISVTNRETAEVEVIPAVNHGEIILKSGILQELEVIEKTLAKTISTLPSGPSGSENPPIFMVDSESQNLFEHRIIHEKSLRSKELISLRYFQRVIDTLTGSFRIRRKYSVFVTNRLPETGDRFMPRFYNVKENVILIQQNHLTDIGLISTIAAHIISHIAAESDFDDRKVSIGV